MRANLGHVTMQALLQDMHAAGSATSHFQVNVLCTKALIVNSNRNKRLCWFRLLPCPCPRTKLPVVGIRKVLVLIRDGFGGFSLFCTYL